MMGRRGVLFQLFQVTLVAGVYGAARGGRYIGSGMLRRVRARGAEGRGGAAVISAGAVMTSFDESDARLG